MEEVHKARDARLDRIVALKVSNSEFRDRFEREARRGGSQPSPYLPTLRCRTNHPVMEHMEGTPL
jgi:hypothetical protein